MSRLWRLFWGPGIAGVLIATFITPMAFAEQRRRPVRQRTGFIEVISLNEGAQVFLDGEEVGSVPLPEKIRAPVGEHSIKVTRRGYTQHLEVVRVKRRRTATVEADLLAISGILRVEVLDVENPRVFIDDDYIGNAPLDHDVEPGSRHLRLELAGYYDFEQTLEVIAGEEIDVNAEMERLPPERDPTIPEELPERQWYEQWWVWTIVGAVVVGLAVGLPVGLTNVDDYCADNSPWDSCEGSISVDVTQ